MKRRITFPMIALCVGLLFLYAPIISMIVYSFNNSRLVTAWVPPPTRWPWSTRGAG